MGAWGSGTFENDYALDWVVDLEGSSGFALVRETLHAVVGTDEYLDVREGSNGVAAAEVVASALGAPAADLPDVVRGWVGANSPAAGQMDATLALRVLDRVRGQDSELAALWRETGDPAWQVGVEDIQARLTTRPT